MLQGGFERWKAEQKLVEEVKAMVMEEPRDFADLEGIQLKDGVIASYADVKAMSADYQLVDNRPKPNFDAGNIPNSINLPFNLLLDPETGYMKDEAGVR